MTSKKNLLPQPVITRQLIKRMLVGAGIALTLIVIFLAGVDETDPDWGRFWMVRPLVIVPAAGAAGGAFFHFMIQFPYQHSWQKILANIISVIVYIIGLWMGVVLGLDGTLWD
jgi:hypothetical protein